MLFKGALTGPSPVDRGRKGSKHHLLTDPGGASRWPSRLLTGNRNDITQLLPLVDGVGAVRGKPGRPRLLAESLFADRGYDFDKYRHELRARGVKRSLHAAIPPTARGSVLAAGSSSAPSPGCTSSGACVPAGSVVPSCTKRSCALAARSSASAIYGRPEKLGG